MLIQPELAWPDGIDGYIDANQTVLFMVKLVNIELPSGPASIQASARKAEL